MFSQYDGMVGIKHLHSDENQDSVCVYLKKAIYDMDIAYLGKGHAVVVAVGGGGAYIIIAKLDSSSKQWLMKSYHII